MLIFIKLIIWLVALLPLSWMVYAGLNNQLGPDPGKALVDGLGLWALRFLLVTLSLRPLRDITHQSIFIRVRRLIGLFCWFYASLHFAASIFYVVGYSWSDLLKAFSEKTYIILGFAAWLMLVPLGVTSNRWSQRRLGRRWVKLHRIIYVIVLFACFHFIWLVRSDYWEPMLYFVFALLLLVLRIPSVSRGLSERLHPQNKVISD